MGWCVNYDAIVEALLERFTCPRTEWHLASGQPLLRRSNERGR